jgi:pimeloyl-ACP methyl ester carboxylesterase
MQQRYFSGALIKSIGLSLLSGIMLLASSSSSAFAISASVTTTASTGSPQVSPALSPQESLSPQKSLLASQFQVIKNGLQSYDASPLRSRTPIVLIHGIGGNNNRLFDWVRFLNFVSQQKIFTEKYKVYLYHYDSTRSVPVISLNMQHQLTDFIKNVGGKPIKVLAYSEGGLLIRNALQDTYLNDKVKSVITIATPFHGSPLANPAWMRSQINSGSIFSIVRMGINPAYTITGRMYPDFEKDFHWDNFDGALGSILNNPKLATNPSVDYALAHKQNFITYGSFFGIDVDPNILKKELNLSIPIPKERASFRNVFRKNLLFSLIRNNIGKLPLAKLEKLEKAEPDKAEKALKDSPLDETSLSMMMLNDGISPISSSLWLGRYIPLDAASGLPKKRLPTSSLWDVLRSLRGKNKVRLFAGLDHRNWMEGTTRTGKAELHDLLNPESGPHNVFEWILKDLMG